MLGDDLLPGAKSAALFMGVTPDVVYNMVRHGRLPTVRVGHKLYFRKSALERVFSADAA